MEVFNFVLEFAVKLKAKTKRGQRMIDILYSNFSVYRLMDAVITFECVINRRHFQAIMNTDFENITFLNA